jgi:hypothetical protein
MRAVKGHAHRLTPETEFHELDDQRGGAWPATPTGRTGRHMILAVWTIADTGNAFYQCSDVSF